jgi:xylose isomerase
MLYVLLLPCLAAGHSCEHELEVARINNVLGNIDANTGEPRTASAAAEHTAIE